MYKVMLEKNDRIRILANVKTKEEAQRKMMEYFTNRVPGESFNIWIEED